MVAFGDVADRGSDGLDNAGGLIAGRARIVRRVILVEMAVPAGQRPAFGALANSGEGRPDPDVVGTRLWDLHVPDLDPPWLGKHHGRRLHRAVIRSPHPALGTI